MTGEAPKIRTFKHSRKGMIRGVVTWESEEWMDLLLVDGHDYVPAGYGIDAGGGDTLRFRKSFATEVEA